MGGRKFLMFKLKNRKTYLVYQEEINQSNRTCHHPFKIQITRHQIIYQTRLHKYSLQEITVYLTKKLNQKLIILTFDQFDHLVILGKSI